MLSPSQVESLKNISDPLIKKRYLKFFQLPQTLRQTIPAVKTNDRIRKVAEKNNLNQEQLWNFSYIVGMVLLGETNITEFVKEIQEKCKMEEESARQVARDINQAVFLPVKEELKKIHKRDKWPREEEQSPVAPLETEPKLE
ncbi:MAG: hypothetical protein U9P63_01645, partial [Patescibacteria group bacterium]|nr:hypothetical protein [Patescibacteria group bacterium]